MQLGKAAYPLGNILRATRNAQHARQVRQRCKAGVQQDARLDCLILVHFRANFQHIVHHVARQMFLNGYAA